MLITTVKQCLNDMAQPPKRETDKPMRCPISGIYKIKGVGDVLAGRVEQGLVNPGEDVIFMPTHTTGTPCEGKVFTVEMHHKRVDAAKPGDNVGMNIKGLDKNNMPRSGDVMVYKKDGTLKGTKSFSCQIQTLVCDSFKNCEGLSRIAFLDGNTVMMLGKVVSTVAREEGAAKKK